MILTAETVPAYIAERCKEIGVFESSEVDELEATCILGGNVNYAFCVTSKKSNKKIFVKQAPEYVAIFGPEGLPLTSERMQKEMDVYEAWKKIPECRQYLPEIYYFDPKNMVVCMEFFDQYTLLDHELVAAKGIADLPASKIAAGLAEFMSKSHAATYQSQVSEEEAAKLKLAYENRAMRDIQLEFVFTKCYKEATDEQRAGLTVDAAFLEEIEDLKARYDGTKGECCLTHGDLHPGSIMVKSSSNDVNDGSVVKVIDPEFTVYGPAGLDVGSLLSGYVLAAVHQKHAENPDACKSIKAAAVEFWTAYQTSLRNSLSETQVRQLEVDSVGFTVAEVCRTALGFAGGRLWLQFTDENEKQAAAIQDALRIVGVCMKGRHEAGIQQLFDEMDKLC